MKVVNLSPSLGRLYIRGDLNLLMEIINTSKCNSNSLSNFILKNNKYPGLSDININNTFEEVYKKMIELKLVINSLHCSCNATGSFCYDDSGITTVLNFVEYKNLSRLFDIIHYHDDDDHPNNDDHNLYREMINKDLILEIYKSGSKFKIVANDYYDDSSLCKLAYKLNDKYTSWCKFYVTTNKSHKSLEMFKVIVKLRNSNYYQLYLSLNSQEVTVTHHEIMPGMFITGVPDIYKFTSYEFSHKSISDMVDLVISRFD